MTRRSFFASDALDDYLLAHTPPADDILRRCAEETTALGTVMSMQIGQNQGAFFTLLTRAVGARTAIEIGTFTGYSAISIARGLPADGHLLCCDVSAEWTDVARRHWTEAGLADRIELRLGPAAETLAALPAEPTYDLAFLDADKTGYPAYWELLLPRMNRNGLILVDNVLSGGSVLEPEAHPNAPAIKVFLEFNDMVATDERVEAVLLSVADGLTIARVR